MYRLITIRYASLLAIFTMSSRIAFSSVPVQVSPFDLGFVPRQSVHPSMYFPEFPSPHHLVLAYYSSMLSPVVLFSSLHRTHSFSHSSSISSSSFKFLSRFSWVSALGSAFPISYSLMLYLLTPFPYLWCCWPAGQFGAFRLPHVFYDLQEPLALSSTPSNFLPMLLLKTSSSVSTLRLLFQRHCLHSHLHLKPISKSICIIPTHNIRHYLCHH